MRARSLTTILLAALGFGLPTLEGGEPSGAVRVHPSAPGHDARDAPPRPAGTLAWDRLAALHASTPSGDSVAAAQQGGVPNRVLQGPSVGPVPEPQPEAPPPPVMPLRDPTEPGEDLRDLVAPLRMGRPGAAGVAIPRATLKGRIIGPSAPPAAIVELHGALYVLHEESELTVDSPEAGLRGLTLRVTRITASEVRIEAMPLGKVIILR